MGTFGDLLKGGTRLALLIAVGLGVLQQWTGASTLFLYAPLIFQKAGFARAEEALLQTIILNLWNLVCTIIAIWLVDRVGRKPLLIAGTAGMALSFVLMGIVFHAGWSGLPVLAIMLGCIGTYAVSLGPLPWLIMSELFPTRVRAKAVAIGSLSVWISLFLANSAFPPLVAYVERNGGTPAAVFWIFALVCCVAVIFGWVLVPETKGRELEEIAAAWSAR